MLRGIAVKVRVGGELTAFLLFSLLNKERIGEDSLIPAFLLFSLLNKDRIGEDSLIPAFLLIPSPMRRGIGRGQGHQKAFVKEEKTLT